MVDFVKCLGHHHRQHLSLKHYRDLCLIITQKRGKGVEKDVFNPLGMTRFHGWNIFRILTHAFGTHAEFLPKTPRLKRKPSLTPDFLKLENCVGN
jgi:hypothetical protein